MICHLVLLTLAKAPQRIVFASYTGEKPSVYVASLDGKFCRKISSGLKRYGEFVWSPGGDKIAFCGGHTGDSCHVFVMRSDGSGLEQLTGAAYYDCQPHWNADGTRIVFNRRQKWYRAFSVDLNGKSVKPVFDPTRKVWGHWEVIRKESPSHSFDLLLKNLKTHVSRRIASLEDYLGNSAWAPDGKNFVCVDQTIDWRRPTPVSLLANKGGVAPKQTLPDCHVNLHSISIPDGKVTKLDSGGIAGIGNLVYSPDGKQIAYLKAMNVDPAKSDSYMQLYVMNRDGSNKRRLTNHIGHDNTPTWTRDGRSIVVASDCGEKYMVVNGGRIFSDGCLRIIDPESGKQKEIHLPVPVFEIALSR